MILIQISLMAIGASICLLIYSSYSSMMRMQEHLVEIDIKISRILRCMTHMNRTKEDDL